MLKTRIGRSFSRQSESADGVHHPQVALERFLVADLAVAPGVGVGAGIGGVDAVDPVLGHQQDVGVEFEGAQRGGGVGGEVGVAGARRRG